MIAIFIKDFGAGGYGPLRHPPIFRKGEEIRIIEIVSGRATIEHAWGEACGYTIPMEYLEKK